MSIQQCTALPRRRAVKTGLSDRLTSNANQRLATFLAEGHNNEDIGVFCSVELKALAKTLLRKSLEI